LVYDLLKVIIIPAYSKNPGEYVSGKVIIMSDFLLPPEVSVITIN